jgi:hypothetical protein
MKTFKDKVANDASHYFSTTFGMENGAVSEIETSLNDGSPAIEGEIEAQLPDKPNQFKITIIIASNLDSMNHFLNGEYRENKKRV